MSKISNKSVNRHPNTLIHSFHKKHSNDSVKEEHITKENNLQKVFKQIVNLTNSQRNCAYPTCNDKQQVFDISLTSVVIKDIQKEGNNRSTLHSSR